MRARVLRRASVHLAAVLCSACGPAAHVEIAPLNFRQIDPPAARFSTIEPDECYWWTDEHGRVWIAMRSVRSFWFVPDPLVFQLSLALDAPPAGAAREYLVSRRELRAVARFGPAQSRFVSMAGIVALYREDGDRMRGSFRLDVAQQTQGLLGGWSQQGRHLMLGTFTARLDAARGREIGEQTEAPGWERTPQSTQPASAPTGPGVTAR